jgi:hypothetical protein
MRIHSLLAVAALLSISVTSSHTEARVLSVPDAFTPVVLRYVGDNTVPVQGSDGRWHVVYELWLSNATPAPASVERIEVLDYDHQSRVVATIAGDALLSNMRDLSLRPAIDASLPPSTSKLVFVELTFGERSAIPEAIVHRLSGTGGSSPAAPRPAPLTYLAAPWDLGGRPPPVIGAPLAGEGWVVMNGCCSTRGAHRGALLPVDGELRDAQRFAIDWVRVDAQGHLVSGDRSRVENYLAYDQPVLAVAAGTVVGVLDGLEDQVPGALPDPASITIDNVDGNHVILDIGRGLYVFYAHLKKGSVRVKLGDRVAAALELGRVGNTGNTSAPHLHLHVMNAPSALGADGLPFVFTHFTLAGMLDPEQWYAPNSQLGDAYRILPGDGPGSRRDELPLDLRIVGFPAATK